ncbi:hypothetical protein L9F63_002268 [Diploptera punctata]|uniref:Protein kinase domain-containing protein n=1 Tax=Diploptera punctata TaxID=6984 RepID=A0AAD8A3R2_DIPPU|nr:hypothetical protein L9F63_002268 [Diploptera punctata]
MMIFFNDSIPEYKVLGKVGEGSFSEVLKCQDRETGALYAAKRLKMVKQTFTEVLQTPEVVAMRKLKNTPTSCN